MNKAFIILTLFLTSTPALHSQTTDPPPGVDVSKLRGICDDVYKNFPIDDHPRFLYVYERKICEAAGITEDDWVSSGSDELTPAGIAKIQAMWKYCLSFGNNLLKCDAANFDVPRGYILKYAVALQNEAFLTTAVEVWQVELNYVDKSDNRTLLDYVEKELERLKNYKESYGDHPRSKLQEFRKILIQQGAKRRSEL